MAVIEVVATEVHGGERIEIRAGCAGSYHYVTYGCSNPVIGNYLHYVDHSGGRTSAVGPGFPSEFIRIRDALTQAKDPDTDTLHAWLWKDGRWHKVRQPPRGDQP